MSAPRRCSFADSCISTEPLSHARCDPQNTVRDDAATDAATDCAAARWEPCSLLVETGPSNCRDDELEQNMKRQASAAARLAPSTRAHIASNACFQILPPLLNSRAMRAHADRSRPERSRESVRISVKRPCVADKRALNETINIKRSCEERQIAVRSSLGLRCIGQLQRIVRDGGDCCCRACPRARGQHRSALQTSRQRSSHSRRADERGRRGEAERRTL